MATESTAIVNLIDLMRKRPMPKEADDDLLFGGNARFDATAMPVQAAPVMLPPPSTPGPHYDHVRLPMAAYDNAKTVARGSSGPGPLLKKLAIPVGAMTAVTIVLTLYFATRDSAPAATPSKPAPVAVVTPPPAAEPATPAAAVAPSEPSVATTVTPIETAVAPAEPANKFSADPALAPTVPMAAAVVPEESRVVAAAERPAKVAKKGSRSKSSRAARTQGQKRDTRVAMIAPVKKVQLGGKGQLAISSVSGGQIWVDGRATKTSRMTLEPGKHNVTMFDKATKKAKTFQVEIKPNQTTTVRR